VHRALCDGAHFQPVTENMIVMSGDLPPDLHSTGKMWPGATRRRRQESQVMSVIMPGFAFRQFSACAAEKNDSCI